MRYRSVAILLFALASASAGGEAPKQMVEAVNVLTEPEAILNICFESGAYERLDATKALQLHELSSRLWRLVDRISKQYDDDVLYVTFGMMSVKKSEDPELQKYTREKYQYCGDSLLAEVSAYVVKAEVGINRILDDVGQKGDRWPQSAKASYIKRCTKSLSSQGLHVDIASESCTCMTEGMEDPV